MSDEKFEAIEFKIAHHEQMLIELNDALAKQQDSIMQLEQLCASIIERISALGEAGETGSAEDERPPHY